MERFHRDGRTIPEIAADLDRDPRTVRKHLGIPLSKTAQAPNTTPSDAVAAASCMADQEHIALICRTLASFKILPFPNALRLGAVTAPKDLRSALVVDQPSLQRSQDLWGIPGSAVAWVIEAAKDHLEADAVFNSRMQGDLTQWRRLHVRGRTRRREMSVVWENIVSKVGGRLPAGDGQTDWWSATLFMAASQDAVPERFYTEHRTTEGTLILCAAAGAVALLSVQASDEAVSPVIQEHIRVAREFGGSRSYRGLKRGLAAVYGAAGLCRERIGWIILRRELFGVCRLKSDWSTSPAASLT